MEGIIAAFITSGLTLVGVIITNMRSNQVIENKLLVAQAVTDTKIDNLTEEVKRHNNFASRMPVVEEQIRVINRRIDDLEAHDKEEDKRNADIHG